MRLWQRLTEWYGSRFIQSYGEKPSRDWCRLADHTSDEDLVKALNLVRQRHPSHPPTFMEFEALVRQPRRTEEQPPSVQEQLLRYVYRTRELTPRQRIGWSWLHSGKAWAEDVRITGVSIPADGDIPGHVVTVEEMERAPA